MNRNEHHAFRSHEPHFLRELTVDAAVGTVRASALFGCALARYVLHDQTRFRQVLVFRVCLGVPEQVKESFRGLLRPFTFVTWSVPLLALVSEENILSLQTAGTTWRVWT